MINQELELFLNYDLPDNFREKFYPILVEYFDFIVPILKKGKHTRSNEMECVGSQSLHLSYVEQSPYTFVIFRNEQGKDTIFKISETKGFQTEITVYEAHSQNSFEERLKRSARCKKTKTGINLEFKDVEDIRKFIKEYQDAASEIKTTDEVIARFKSKPKDKRQSMDEMLKDLLKETKKKDYKPLPNPVFAVSVYDDGKIHARGSKPYTFEDELRIFDLMNTMLCGVSSHAGVKIPKQFLSQDPSEFVKKLTLSIPKK